MLPSEGIFCNFPKVLSVVLKEVFRITEINQNVVNVNNIFDASKIVLCHFGKMREP